MSKKNKFYNVIEQYEADVEGLDFRIKGKILESDKFYEGLISHFCKPSEDSTSQYEINMASEDLYHVRRRLKQGLENFTAIDVTVNKLY